MTITLRHYTWGMLRMFDTDYVAGDEMIVASTPDIADDILRQVRQSVTTGLEPWMLQNDDVYAFFPLIGTHYVACHFQTAELFSEKRGAHLFREYILVEEDHLEHLGWNLIPIFELLFSPIKIYTAIDREQAHYRLEPSLADVKRDWFDAIVLHPAPTQSALVKLLTSSPQTQILNASIGSKQRLYWFCGMLQCLPVPLRRSFSFCTLAPSTSSSARIIFVHSGPSSSTAVNWRDPGRVSGSGSVFATWIRELLHTNAQKLQQEVASLRLPTFEEPSIAHLDLAVEFGKWNGTSIAIEDEQSLRDLAQSIRRYQPLLTEAEVVKWLGMLVTHAILHSKPDVLDECISQNASMLKSEDTRKAIIRRITEEVLVSEYATHLPQFIIHMNAIGQKYSDSAVTGFARDTVLACMEANADQGLRLWRGLISYDWGRDNDWVVSVLQAFNSINAAVFAELVAVLAELTVDAQALVQLGKLMTRSSRQLKQRYPQTLRFLEWLDRPEALEASVALEILAESHDEIKNSDWFVCSVQVALEVVHVTALPSGKFVNRLSELLYSSEVREQTKAGLVKTLIDHSEIVRAIPENDLITLMDSSVNAQDFELAAVCFVSAVNRRELLRSYGWDLPALVSKVRREIPDDHVHSFARQLARELLAIDTMSLTELQEWLDFMKYVMKKDESCDILASAYMDAFQALLQRRHLQDVTDFSAVFGSRYVSSQRSFVLLLSRMIHEIVRSQDAASWIHLAKQVSSHPNLVITYRAQTEFVCLSLPIDQVGLSSVIDTCRKLRSARLNWEAGLLVFAVMRFPLVEPVGSIADSFAGTLRSIALGEISLDEVGSWVNSDLRSPKTRLINLLCKSMIELDLEDAKDTKRVCMELLNESTTVPENRKQAYRHGRDFMRTVVRTLEQELKGNFKEKRPWNLFSTF